MWKIWKKLKWMFHPITMLVIAQVCWGLLMFVWIRWYVLRSQEINALLEKIHSTSSSGHWVILAEGCLLMAFILVGLYIIFVSQRRLSRLAKMQDAILSSVTHELKTPLASIRLYAETMLLRPVVESERKVFLQRTISETERLQRLIDTVLLSARLEFDKTNLAKERVDVIGVVASAVNRVRERFSNIRQIHYTAPKGAHEDEPFIVLGNRLYFMNLLDNLLDNAVKYTLEGGIIQIETQVRKDILTISVKDNGFGIEKKYLKKIFKKFFRIDTNPRVKVGGSGLGLSLCKSIVKELGGNIYATSEGLNKGTTFYVELKRLSSDR